MANTRELRRRIKSIKNTSQITKAMQMVAATKMRKAQNQALGARPYSLSLTQILLKLSGKVNPEAHLFLSPNDSRKIGIILMSSDKGLCGALNSNLFRLVMNDEAGIMNNPEEVVFYTLGKKGRDFVIRAGKNLVADFESHEIINFSDATKIRKFILSLFLNNEVGEIYLLYPHFVSTIRQEARMIKMLPVNTNVVASEAKQPQDEIASSPSTIAQDPRNDNNVSEFLFEPSADSVLDYALTHYIDTQIFQVLLETKASEHSARMVAMKNATDNAKDLVSDLSLTYNQVRQSAVTTELLEITSAGAALE